MENTLTQNMLIERLAWPLNRKIQETWNRIEQWHEACGGNISASYSGGLDSTVMLDLIRTHPRIDGRNVPAYFADTGSEYPEIRKFVKRTPGVIWVRPKKKFIAIIKEYGYPVVSKKISQYVKEVQRAKTAQTVRLRLTGYRKDGSHSPMSMIPRKWHFLVGAPFCVSDQCCHYLKKCPLKQMEMPMIGVRATEGANRASTYLRTGCNAFDQKSPRSWPIAFWTDDDIWQYIKDRKLPYCSLYDMGYTRTGCFPCMLGVHLEKWPNRFQMMEKTHPRLWDHCMDRYGIQRILDYINDHLPKKQQISYRWSDYQSTQTKKQTGKQRQMSFDFIK